MAAPAGSIPVKARGDAYTVLQQIGRGAFGDVFLCERKADGRRLCMKEVELHLLSATERKGCLAEVELFKRLTRCPHIVGFYEAFWDSAPDQMLLVVLEYGDAGDLEGFIQARRLDRHEREPLNEQEAMDIFQQIALGVRFLHSHSVIHRDLKAKNVFLFQNGRAVIGDFGTSKTLSSATACGSTLVGSPLYMSPEILEGEPHSFATDVWSLGCILYELLSLESPFAGPSYPAVVLKITQGSYKPLGDSVSESMRVLVAKMLQKDQHKRPTMEDIFAMDMFQGRGGRFTHLDVDVVSGAKLKCPTSQAPVRPDEHCQAGSIVSSASILPPPAPVEMERAPSAPVGPAQVQTKSTNTTVAVLPTSRAKVAHVVASQRLHLHRQQQSARVRQATTSPLYHLDLGLPDPPQPPSRGLHPQSLVTLRQKTTAAISTAKKRPAKALPPANMVIIGRKVKTALLSSTQAAGSCKRTPPS